MSTLPPKAAAVALLAALACGEPSAEPLSQADRDAVRQADEELQRAVTDGDWDAVAAHYVEDAYLDPPNSPPVTGRSAIREHFAATMGGVTGFELDPQTVQGEGRLAYVRGRWTMTTRAPGAEGDSTVSGRGGYVVVRRQQEDGSWLIVEDIVHSGPATPRRGAAGGDGGG